MLRTADLDYHLPEDRIATTPAVPRDAARLLVISRTDEARREHRTVRDLPDILRPPALRASMPHDLVVVNATRVLPARFKGVRTDTGGGVEGLYLRPAPAAAGHIDHPPSARWIVLLKMRRARPGAIVQLRTRAGQISDLALHLIDRTAEDNGAWIAQPLRSGVPCPPRDTQALLESIGLTPVPPYIVASRKKHHLDIADDRDRAAYQTVYAEGRASEGHGSVAAPTAGLHFTPDLLARLADTGIQRAECSLDVGLGTFKPVETEFLEQHPMHSEWCHVPRDTAEAIRRWRTPAAGQPAGRIIAVGTTTARTLESFDSPDQMLGVPSRDTRLLITPGYRFKHIDALLTNFHLPQSTLLALVAAFLTPPGSDPAHAMERLRSIYAEAIREQYRFFSFGDAMLILP